MFVAIILLEFCFITFLFDGVDITLPLHFGEDVDLLINGHPQLIERVVPMNDNDGVLIESIDNEVIEMHDLVLVELW